MPKFAMEPVPMFAIEPVTLTIKLTVTKATENGLLSGFTDVEVLSANGEADARFYGFVNYRGAMVLNFKAEGRQAKPAKADKAPPKALTASQKAMIPANGVKGKPKAAEPKAAEPKAAQSDMAAIVAAVMAAMQAK